MEFKPRKGEVVVKEIREGWHAIRHGEKVKWLRTAYKTKLWRQLILTNQRILFLKDDEVAYELSLEDILKAETKRVMRFGDPYLRLHLKNGELAHVVFESIRERAWGSILGVPTEMGTASRITEDWTNEINSQIGNVKK